MGFGTDMDPALRRRWVEHLLEEGGKEASMRAKFFVDSVCHHAHAREAHLRAVYDGSQENNQFATATPSGELHMTVSNPAAFDFLEPGKSYYLDFKQAPD